MLYITYIEYWEEHSCWTLSDILNWNLIASIFAKLRTFSELLALRLKVGSCHCWTYLEILNLDLIVGTGAAIISDSSLDPAWETSDKNTVARTVFRS